jgi:hypothetical protein
VIYSHQKQRSVKRGHEAPAYSLDELRNRLLSDPLYTSIHKEWVESGYQKDLTPSIDRIDDYKGYSFDNIRIVTWKENNKRYQRDRVAGINNKHNSAVVCLSADGSFVNEYHSQKDAFRKTGIPNTSIAVCCKKKNRTAGGYYWRFKDEYEQDVADGDMSSMTAKKAALMRTRR